MILNENFTDFISILNKHEVKYVLVGDWVVIFEGYSRTTGDMDVFIEISETNASKILQVINEFMGSSLGFVREDFLKENNILMIGKTPLRIDIITTIDGVSFEEAYTTSRIYTDEGTDIRCIHINELIRNKRASGRLKDLADAEMLEKILKKRKNKQ